MPAGELITREELTGYMFRVADIADNVDRIRRILEEEDGWEEEEEP